MPDVNGELINKLPAMAEADFDPSTLKLVVFDPNNTTQSSDGSVLLIGVNKLFEWAGIADDAYRPSADFSDNRNSMYLGGIVL